MLVNLTFYMIKNIRMKHEFVRSGNLLNFSNCDVLLILILSILCFFTVKMPAIADDKLSSITPPAIAASATTSVTPPAIATSATTSVTPPAVTTSDQATSNTSITTSATKTNQKNPTQINPFNSKDYLNDLLITIGTSNSDGIYYPAGSSICLYLNHDQEVFGLRCRAYTTKGSFDNLVLLREAKIDFAIIQSDWQKFTLYGTDKFQNYGPYDKLRFVFSLHDEALAIIVKKASGIKNLDDLANKIVNIGAPGSNVRRVMDNIAKIKNWNYNSTFRMATELKVNEQAEALCNGQIDAMIVLVGHPNEYVKKVTRLCETTILNVNSPEIIDFVNKNNEYKLSTIPGGIYLGIPIDVKTIAVKATLVSSTDTSDDVVYKLTKAVFNHLNSLRMIHPAFHNLTIDSMLHDGMIVPIHPGVMKYLHEINYDVSKIIVPKS